MLITMRTVILILVEAIIPVEIQVEVRKQYGAILLTLILHLSCVNLLDHLFLKALMILRKQ